jgi:hypothetical protein
MDVEAVANAIVYMDSLPLDANVQFMTVMATKMPFVARLSAAWRAAGGSASLAKRESPHSAKWRRPQYPSCISGKAECTPAGWSACLADVALVELLAGW